MGGGTESKKQLGKILLQQKLVSADELQEMLDEQKRDPRTRLASSAALRGRVSVADALQALSEQHGLGAIDLTEQVVALSLLRLVPLEMAQEHIVFPVRVEEDRLVLAMSTPDAQAVIEELEFVTGKAIVPVVTLDQSLRGVILHAYAAFARGEEYYVGAHVTRAQLADMGLPDLPRAPDSLVPAAPTPEPVSAAAATTGAEPETDELRLPSIAPGLDEAFSQRAPLSLMPPMMSVPNIESRVLLAVADPALRDEIAHALNDAGLSLLETNDGAQALSLLGSKPRVVVLDAVLSAESTSDAAPMHGLDICRKLRADSRYAHLPVIMIGKPSTGWRYARDLQESLGVKHCFERPLDTAKLTQTVLLVLDGQPVVDELPPLSSAAEALWSKAMTAYERGDFDAAIVELSASVQIEPRAFEPHYHLGLLHGRRDELFAAISELELALQLQPHNFAAMKNLAVIYQRVGFRYEALDAWQRAMVHAPDAETRANIKQHMVSLL